MLINKSEAGSQKSEDKTISGLRTSDFGLRSPDGGSNNVIID